MFSFNCTAQPTQASARADRAARRAAGRICVADFKTGPVGSTRILCVSRPPACRDHLWLPSFVICQLGPAITVFDTAPPRAEPHPSAPDDIDPNLLYGVQAYLTSVRRGHRPDTVAADAWDRFFAACGPLIRTTVLGCRIPPHQVEDCVQEAWIEIAQKLPAFCYDRRRGRFKGWLHQLVRRKTLKYKRQLDSADCNPDAAESELSGVICFRFPEPSAACQKRETHEQFHAALAEFRRQVPWTTFRVLQLVSLEGRPVAEIVQRLDLTPRQVWKLHHRAKAKLRRFLEQREEFAEKFQNRPE